jgi:hypothetical protein
MSQGRPKDWPGAYAMSFEPGGLLSGDRIGQGARWSPMRARSDGQHLLKSGCGKVIKMPAALRIRQRVALVLLVAFVEGCSTSAGIERRSGPTIVGRIDYSDANRLYVTGDDDERYSIERSDVISVDHPGKIGTVIGTITSGVGMGFLLLAFAPSPADPTHNSDYRNLRALSAVIGISYLVTGLPILIGNLAVHSRSTAAATTPQPPLQPIPARLLSP